MSVYHLLTTVNEASSTPEEGQKGTKMLLGRMGGLAVLALLALGGPALAQMPGYQIVGQDQNGIEIRFHGACHGCPSSTMTLQMGIERNIREKIPEVTAVVPVP